MSEKNRVVTFIAEIEDSEEAKVFWMAHINNSLISGCKIIGIAEGDLIIENQKLSDFEFEKDCDC